MMEPIATPDPVAPEQLQLALRELQVVMDSAGVGILFVSHRRVVRCNRMFAEIFGCVDTASLVGRSTMPFYVSEQSFRELGEQAYPVMARGLPFQAEMEMLRSDGSRCWTHLTGKMVNPQDKSEGAVWIIDDISQRKVAQAQLENVLSEQSLILDNAMVGIVFLRDRLVTRCNTAFEVLFGYEPGELHGSSSRQWYLNEADWQEAGRLCYAPLSQGRTFEGEMLLRKKDGGAVYFDVRAKAIDPADLSRGSIWITMDISARKQAEFELLQTRANLELLVEQRTQELQLTVAELEKKAIAQQEAEAHIQRLAHFDALTGLPNRVLLNDRFAGALSAAHRSHHNIALIFVDLDHFKNINDSLGHSIGDQVLVVLAGRLKAVMREQDTVARLGGDEFVLLLPDTDAMGAAHVADKLVQGAQQSFRIEPHEFTVTLSLGVAVFPHDGADLDTLSRCADAAMYQAKAEGRNGFRFFTPEIQAQSDRNLRLGNASRKALERAQLALHYQPQMSMSAGQLTGCEALLRWYHPELGAVSPGEFIPILEGNGMIWPIGEWVLRTAVAQLAQWDTQGFPPITVAVNLSAVQFRNAELPSLVAGILHEAGLNPHRLELELTESVAMTHPNRASTVMDELRASGVHISIDDFGTGYSSLSYLKRFHVKKLKIDQSFVRDITVDPDDKAIVGAVISMAQRLGIHTIAEGVETQGQLDYLRACGCDEAQGYFFSRPLPREEFEEFMKTCGR